MKRLSVSLLCAGFLAGCGGARAVVPEGVRPVSRTAAERGFDVAHYRLTLDLHPERRALDGVCEVWLVPTRERLGRVVLDLEELEVSGVEDGWGRALAFEHADGRLVVDLGTECSAPQQVELRIAYAGEPRKGLWFAGGTDAPTHVFTQGECEDSRWWFPCVDEPGERATHELVVSMPESWISVAAGAKLDSRVVDGRRVEHWRATDPHPAYLTTLVAGDLIRLEGEWRGLPLEWLSEPAVAPWLEPSLAETDEALAFLTELTGVDYPYEKYAQACVENFPFGGMENLSATTLTAAALQDERGLRDDSPTGLVVHEAAHQWFGDLLTCREWSHIWLNEGFATYFTNVYFERTRGADDFRVRMRRAVEDYVRGDSGGDRRPIVHSVYRDPIDLFFGGHTYSGGASRLHLLRWVLGDDDFFRGVRLYTAENRGRGVTTSDLRVAFERASGKDLESFFEQWLESPGHPEFEVSWKYDEAGGQVLVTVDQTQEIGDGTLAAYQTPVGIEVRTESGRRLGRFPLARRREILRIPVDGRPLWVRFDKYGWIPKTLRARKSLDEWLAIAREDDDVCGRLDAVAALAKGVARASDEDALRAIEALRDVARGDSSEAVRAAALATFAELRSEPAMRMLMEAGEQDESASCRVAALRTLAHWGESEELARYAEEQFAAGWSWKTMIAAAELLRFAAPRTAAERLEEWLEVPSPHGSLRAGVLEHLAALRGAERLVDLAQLALDATEPQAVRIAAVEGLAEFGHGSREVSNILFGLLRDRDHRLRTAVLEGLAELDDDANVPRLADYYATCVFPRHRRILERMLRGRS